MGELAGELFQLLHRRAIEVGAGGRDETAQGIGHLQRRSDGGLDAAGQGDPGGRRERQRRQPHLGRGHARAAVTGVGYSHIMRQTRRHERGQCDLAPTTQREPSGERRQGREGKTERLERFKRAVFEQEVELHFLEHKLDFDQVEYSLIRVRDENLAFELHQRLLEGEATFAELAPQFSEGPERESEGRLGPYPLSQAHEVVAEKLRISQPGQLWPPFFLVNIWLILRLERWDGARLNDERREEVLTALFDRWLDQRARLLLAGETPPPLPLHLLSEAA